MTNERVSDPSSVASPPRCELSYEDIEIEAPIGSGGQAVVLKGRVTVDDGPEVVALKEPQADPETLDDEALEAFLTEIRAWETVDERERTKPRWEESEHIVGVVASGDDVPWIAVEYMDGGGLHDRLAADPDGLPVGEALYIAESVCRGVELAHNYGVAHLDLKPANVLFRRTEGDEWDVPKVSDWGLARVLDEESGSMEALSVTYAAPEQFEPSEFGDPDMLTDIYQIGVLLYQMLAGEPPFTGSRLSTMRDIVDGDQPEPPSAHRDGISAALDAVVLTALERDKNKRYGAIRNFGDAIAAIRNDDPLPRLVTRRLEETEHVARPDGPQLPPTADRWPMFHGGPTRTGFRSGVDAPTESASKKWAFRTGFWIDSSPVVTDGTVYVGSDDDRLYAVETGSGEQKWAFPTEDRVQSSPAVANGIVYVGSNDGRVYAVDAETGAEHWRFETGAKVRSSPAVASGTVVVGSDDEHLYAVDAETGTQQWRFRTDNRVRSSPALSAETAFVGSGDGYLYAVDIETGQQEWAVDTGSWVASSPAVAEGIVYVGSDSGTVYAIDTATGESEWTRELGGSIRSSPAVSDERLLVESGTGTLYALSVGNGQTQWTYDREESADAAPAIVDDTVLVESGDGSLYALDAEAGTQRWSFETAGPLDSAPAVTDGTIYVGSTDKHLYALE